MQEPTIIYQDQDMLVVNKPAGMTVNKADTTKSEMTLQDWVEKNGHVILGEQPARQINQENNTYDPAYEFYTRGGIVHRLDKETSGIILVAKNSPSFAKLKEQFMGRTVKKTYQALAHGKIVPEVGEINAPVGRQEFNRMRFGVVAGGREALTRYHVVSNFKHQLSNKQSERLSLVELEPQTGRTHQIRVHLKYLNHPIFSDELYAGRKTARDDRKLLPRLFLHAAGITFHHPTTGEAMHFVSPLTEELQEFLAKLNKQIT